mmetsp:Transcript_21883/g.58352  ORF Transcript_21883/g.58352 Transcript_21883/m.58352 type:complete len:106 (+) Transcript_21883:460-777(+)
MTAVISLLGICCSSILPVICVLYTVYFGLQYVFQRYLLADPPIDGGGIMFRGAFQQIIISLMFKTPVVAADIGVSYFFAAVHPRLQHRQHAPPQQIQQRHRLRRL